MWRPFGNDLRTLTVTDTGVRVAWFAQSWLTLSIDFHTLGLNSGV
jgi:hypothetical protein